MPNDPSKLGKTVVAFYATGGETRAIGECVGYSNAPQYLIETDGGEKIWWNENLVRLSEPEDFMGGPATNENSSIEERHCFKQEAHSPHVWHDKYGCNGNGIDPETGKVRVVRGHEGSEGNPLNFGVEFCGEDSYHGEHTYKSKDFLYHCPGNRPVHTDKDGETDIDQESAAINTKPAILDGRTAYGDKVQNQVEQAAMINAYLSGREVRPVDVPAIFMLVKLHRLGKMPDYVDSYDDIEGYLSIARDVIGEDMIHAATAKEYMEIKNRGNQQDGRTLDYGNPYRNVRDED